MDKDNELTNLTIVDFCYIAQKLANESTAIPSDIYRAFTKYNITLCASISDGKTSFSYENTDTCPNEIYHIGDYTIVITPEAAGHKAYLSVKYKDEIRVARLLPSLHKARTYAMNILAS